VRRLAPRPLAAALGGVTARLAPPSLLGRVQGCWRDAVGDVIGSEAEPVSEHDGVVTVSCRSSVWAEELRMMAPELRTQVNQALAEDAVSELRFTASSRPSRRV
jgi:predicted nucleic acid-binding Zn ribbon protein